MVGGLQDFIDSHNIGTSDGKLVLYKAVSREWGSLYVRMVGYERGAAGAYLPGTVVRVRKWGTSREVECDYGLHVCTLSCAIGFLDCDLFFSRSDNRRRLVEVLVDPKDVVAVPFRDNGKIRCKRLVVVGEVTRKGNPRRERDTKQGERQCV